VSFPKIQNIEHSVLYEKPGADLLNPFPAPLSSGGCALVFQEVIEAIEPKSFDFAKASRVGMVQGADPGRWAGAQAAVIPDSDGCGYCPALHKIDGDQYILFDWRWGFYAQDARPNYGFRMPGWDGWVGFGDSFVRTAVRDKDQWTFGPAQILNFEKEKMVRTGPSLVTLGNGALLAPAFCADRFKNQFMNHVFMLRSEDSGATWRQLGTLDKRDKQYAPLTESVAAATGADSITALIRTTNKFDFMLSTSSQDQGATWSLPEKTDLQGHPTDLIALDSSLLMCAFALLPDAEGAAKRRPGIRVAFSSDNGKTWPEDSVAHLRDDSPESKFDRARILDLGNSRYLAAYQGLLPDGRCAIFGTHFDLA